MSNLLKKILELNQSGIKIEFVPNIAEYTVIRLTDLHKVDLRFEECNITYESMVKEENVIWHIDRLLEILRPAKRTQKISESSAEIFKKYA